VYVDSGWTKQLLIAWCKRKQKFARHAKVFLSFLSEMHALWQRQPLATDSAKQIKCISGFASIDDARHSIQSTNEHFTRDCWQALE